MTTGHNLHAFLIATVRYLAS